MKAKPWLTPIQRVLDSLSIVLCVGTIIYIAAVYQNLPQQIATHFDSAGQVTGYQGKSMLIMLAFFMVFLITLPMCILVRIRKLYTVMNTPWPIPKGQERIVAENAKDFLCITNLSITAMFAYLTYCCISSRNPGLWVWLPILAMAFALVAFLMRTKKGCKAPKDKDPWDRTYY